MHKATISQLKNNLSAYLKRVRSGESILVCDRDEPIARLDRVTGAQSADARINGLARQGLLRPAQRPLSLETLRRPVPKPGRSVVEALIEERREGR